MSVDLAKAIAVTAEMCGGRELSKGAAQQFVRDLSEYPEPHVLRALDRCRRELQRPLTLAAVLERIDDGRPGADEAFAMLPTDERMTVVWTTEMAEAWGIAGELDDRIAMRMAFRDAYNRIVANNRASRVAPVWQASLGHDPDGREHVLRNAVALGRLTSQHVERVLLPYHKPTVAVELAILKGAQMLQDKREPIPDKVLAFLPQRKSAA